MSNNPFSHAYYRQVIARAKSAGYTFHTLKQFLEIGAPAERAFVLRHDLDTKPGTLWPLLECEREMAVRSTIFVRVMANDYNALGYTVLPRLREAEAGGFEIGLHTSFVEYATIVGLENMRVLAAETAALKAFFTVHGVACHRDINYAYNSLPWLEQNWSEVRRDLGLSYQAYAPEFLERAVYVNEGFSPHLGWRNLKPEDVIDTGRSICLLTHSHWWYRDHPFEV
ncbi:MAG: hypothetical protein FJX54_21285 [Alphaproteobacteria bacterium]|nr:hypothetical protein [Alphaproteobacteria bacterium]